MVVSAMVAYGRWWRADEAWCRAGGSAVGRGDEAAAAGGGSGGRRWRDGNGGGDFGGRTRRDDGVLTMSFSRDGNRGAVITNIHKLLTYIVSLLIHINC